MYLSSNASILQRMGAFSSNSILPRLVSTVIVVLTQLLLLVLVDITSSAVRLRSRIDNFCQSFIVVAQWEHG